MSCASIVSGSKYKIRIDGDTKEPLTIVTEKKVYHDVLLPTKVKIKRHGIEGQRIKIQSKTTEYPDIVLRKKVNGWAFLNFVSFFGAPIGWTIDLATNSVSIPEQRKFYIGTKETQESIYLDLFSPEESGLNLVKITDETNGNVVGATIDKLNSNLNYTNLPQGFSKNANLSWKYFTNLSISPDGSKIAFVSIINDQANIMVKNTTSQGMSTQRTFRNVHGGINWGVDNQLYFGDNNAPNYYVSSVNATQGSVMNQHTNGNVDDSFPILSSDGNILYFTRWQPAYGPSVWSLNKKDGTLSSCARGYNACPVPGKNDSFYCVRNTSDGKSEIWLINYVKGVESIILSDINHSFTNPVVSPDGQWLLVVGNAQSSISKKQNLDIFAVRTDGTQLTQLTYHPEQDFSPVWGKDGKSIYFISSRANKARAYNVWRMNFNL